MLAGYHPCGAEWREGPSANPDPHPEQVEVEEEDPDAEADEIARDAEEQASHDIYVHICIYAYGMTRSLRILYPHYPLAIPTMATPTTAIPTMATPTMAIPTMATPTTAIPTAAGRA